MGILNKLVYSKRKAGGKGKVKLNPSPFVPLPLGIYEGKGEYLKEGLAPLLNTPLWGVGENTTG